MNLSFADTLYFKKENVLEIILGLHRSYKILQKEIQICCEVNNLTFNELLVLLEIRINKKGCLKNNVCQKTGVCIFLVSILHQSFSKFYECLPVATPLLMV